ncbi:MAG: hypothetical protein VXU46_04360, partial [Planctomycetota bacterium]|nr:hypothetical protein [Planctomycetota bacterium]
YIAIDGHDNGPFSKVEDGWHVRRGYTRAMYEELCTEAGLMLEEVSYCSGFFSQKITAMDRKLRNLVGVKTSWALLFPLRLLPPLLDGLMSKLAKWPSYSICLEAYKPRSQTPRALKP